MFVEPVPKCRDPNGVLHGRRTGPHLMIQVRALQRIETRTSLQDLYRTL